MKKKQRKNCPECRYWRHSRRNYSCTKNPERMVYNPQTLPEDPNEREWCLDMKKRRKP